MWILPAACGMLAGWWLGGATRPDGPAELGRNTRGMSERRKVYGSNKNDDRDFKVELARFERSGGFPEAAMKAVESADSHKLREWMLSLANEKIDERNVFANLRRNGILTQLALQLFQREGERLVAWAQGTGNNLLLVCTLSVVARDRVEAVKSIFRANLKDGQIINPFYDENLYGAASRSADEALKIEQAGNTHSVAYRFADDFDFSAYLANTKSEFGIDQAMRYWAAKDPDAVAKALGSKLGVNGATWHTLFSKAYQGRAAMVGETEAARWIWPVLRDLTPGEKAKVYPEMLQGETELNLALWEAASDDMERAELLSLSPNGNRDGSVADWLNRLGSEELRSKTIARWIERQRALPSPARSQSLGRIIEKTALSDSNKEQLRERLAEP